MAGKMPSKANDGKRKSNDRNHHNSNGGHSSTRQGNTSRGGRGGHGRGRGGHGGRGNNSEHLKNVECFNCGKKGHYSTDCSLPRKMTMNSQTWFPRRISKPIPILIEGNVDQKGQTIKEKRNDDLISINDTDTFDYSMQDKITHKNGEHNNYNYDYDELAYPFSKRIKLKHEPEKAQENVPVQFTADIIVEMKNRDGTVVPMRALLDTGTTSTIILR
jgi:hypothetical protein